MSEINLDELLEGIKPNIVTPHFNTLTGLQNNKKPKVLAHVIMKGLVSTLEQSKAPVTKEVMHAGKIHKIVYVDIEPLLTGPWAMMSLMILPLSYGEQSTIIESLYPARAQLSAKAFAVTFTTGMTPAQVQIVPDERLVRKVDEANAGIAMILSMMGNADSVAHSDEIVHKRDEMGHLVDTMYQREAYRKSHKRSQDAAKHQDMTMGGM